MEAGRPYPRVTRGNVAATKGEDLEVRDFRRGFEPGPSNLMTCNMLLHDRIDFLWHDCIDLGFSATFYETRLHEHVLTRLHRLGCNHTTVMSWHDAVDLGSHVSARRRCFVVTCVRCTRYMLGRLSELHITKREVSASASPNHRGKVAPSPRGGGGTTLPSIAGRVGGGAITGGHRVKADDAHTSPHRGF